MEIALFVKIYAAHAHLSFPIRRKRNREKHDNIPLIRVSNAFL